MKKKLFLKKFSWTRKKHFWKTCWLLLIKLPKRFWSKDQKANQFVVLLTKNFFKVFHWTSRRQIWQNWEKKFGSSLKTFCSNPKKGRKYYFFWKNFFKKSSGHLECSFDSTAQKTSLNSLLEASLIIFQKVAIRKLTCILILILTDRSLCKFSPYRWNATLTFLLKKYVKN